MKQVLPFLLMVASAAAFRDRPAPAQQATTAAPAESSATSGPGGAQADATKPENKSAPDPAAALDFLGSYSAPQAVLATETGHTSSRPPSAGADSRLADLARDLGEVPAQSADARRNVLAALASPDHSPGEWFRAGTAALTAARADSRRLAEIAPSGEWDRRFQAEALAARYPLVARSLWSGPRKGARMDTTIPDRGGPALSEPVSPASLSRWRDELSGLDKAAESPEILYRRARLLLDISGAAYRQAAVSPALDARLFALQALAAEEENDEGAALSEYRAGLAKYPESGLLHAGLGHLHRERNELAAARAELKHAKRLLPSDALVTFDLGDVELRMGEPGRALETLDGALDLDPNLLVARWSRGRAYAVLGGNDNDQRALDDLEAAASCDTTGALQLQLSRLYARLGRSSDAREAEQKSVEQRRAAGQGKAGAELKTP